MADRDVEQEPLTQRPRFQPPSNIGGPANRAGRVPKNKLPPQARPVSNKPSEKIYWLQMYITGFLVCWVFEGLILGCLAQWRLMEVGTIFSLIYACAAIFLTCIFWNKPLSKQITMAVIGVASFAALSGGLFGGSYLQTFWHYSDKNTWNNVGSAAKPSSWQGGGQVANVFQFVNRSYVNVNLAGVVYRSGDLAYCVAPILGKDPVAQEVVIYYAASIDCCSGTSKANVHTQCYHWGDHDLVGERIPDHDLAFFELAVTKASGWNSNFMTDPIPVFLNMMSPADHMARQEERKRDGMIVIIATPFGWPILALIIYVLRWLTIATCGVHRKSAPSQYQPVGQTV